jgi:hypothetical protein
VFLTVSVQIEIFEKVVSVGLGDIASIKVQREEGNSRPSRDTPFDLA